MAGPYHIGILGATSLPGRELAPALEARRFPAPDPTLWENPEAAAAAGKAESRLVAFGDEPAVMHPFSAAALEDVDLVFLAGDAAESVAAAATLEERGVPFVDLGAATGAPVVGLDAAAAVRELALDLEGDRAVLAGVALAHPGAQALAYLLERLATAGRLESATAVVFEPASQRGWPGIQELEGQSTRVLALQSLPTAVFGAQVAFNLRAELGEEARPALAEIRHRLARHTGELLRRSAAGAAVPFPAIQLLQAATFHGTALALALRYAEPAPPNLDAALEGAFLQRAPGQPDLLAAAGEEALLAGMPWRDPYAAGVWWLHASLDNLRRLALGAVDAALELLHLREAAR